LRQHLVLVPGLSCDEAVWAPQASALADLASVRVAEHGLRDSLDGMAEAIIATAPPRFALAGHSMGGRVALEVMRRAGRRVSGLALLDTGYTPLPAGDAGRREAEGRQELLELAQREGMRAVGRRWLRIPMIHASRVGDQALIDAILDMFERHTPAQFAAQVHALLTRPDATDVLGKVSVPTLVLCGREDAWSQLAQHRAMAAMIPGSMLVSVPECGHMATLERPDSVNRALRGWLQAIQAGAPAQGG
jgi:pimeloyl-ACP methyl ester carboxylesterase